MVTTGLTICLIAFVVAAINMILLFVTEREGLIVVHVLCGIAWVIGIFVVLFGLVNHFNVA